MLKDDPASLYAAVGAAFARWPDGTVADLQDLAGTHPGSALVQLHLGLARFWLRQDAEAKTAWQAAERVEPDSAAAIRAEGLLHPEMPEGRPFFVPSASVPQDVDDLLPLEQLAELERRANTSSTAKAWILYGTALQRVGRPLSAAAAFDRAVEIDPDDVEAQTAAALVRFTKDDPSRAFSKLGPLSKEHPDAAVVRFHLGLALLWLRDVEGARKQLEQAAKAEPASIYARAGCAPSESPERGPGRRRIDGRLTTRRPRRPIQMRESRRKWATNVTMCSLTRRTPGTTVKVRSA